MTLISVLNLFSQETPIPGSYEMESQGLFYDIDKKKNTYRFKSDGRKINPLPHYKGPRPSPGEYEHTTFLDRYAGFCCHMQQWIIG